MPRRQTFGKTPSPRWRLRHQSLTVYLLLGLVGLCNIWIISSSMNPTGESANPKQFLALRVKADARRQQNVGRSQNMKQKRRNVTSVQKRKLPKGAPCVRLECIQDKAEALSRSFILSQNQTWRSPPPSNSLLYNGLLYVKVPKTGSSTVAGAAIRIAKAHHVPVQYDHSSGQEYTPDSRNLDNSFLFTTVRDPAQRAMSYIAYESSRTQTNVDLPTLLDMLRSMDRLGVVQKSEGRGGTQLAFTSLQPIPKHSAWKPSFPEYVVRADRVEQNVANILKSYHFVLVTERMEESLVALAMLLGVSIHDVLVFSAKRAATTSTTSEETGFLAVHNKGGGMSCVPLRHLPNIMLKDSRATDYLQSDEWMAMNYGDYILHLAATRSLDKTIHDIGEGLFRRNLEELQDLTKNIERQCRLRVHGPCSSNGTLQWRKSSQNCYTADYGCGHRCIDEMLGERTD